uniref:Uncharacterized protein n=1 Tax=Oryza sativa subsp. japonica TaxID=39947 RepID=Q6K4V0_ORYSJ|nr:hypothetical protein [Oryza sativa Japonica Group]
MVACLVAHQPEGPQIGLLILTTKSTESACAHYSIDQNVNKATGEGGRGAPPLDPCGGGPERGAATGSERWRDAAAGRARGRPPSASAPTTSSSSAGAVGAPLLPLSPAAKLPPAAV